MKVVAKPIVHVDHYLVGLDEPAGGVAWASKPIASESRQPRRAREIGNGEKPARQRRKSLKLVEK